MTAHDLLKALEKSGFIRVRTPGGVGEVFAYDETTITVEMDRECIVEFNLSDCEIEEG